MKNNQENILALFQPTFGNRPVQYIGRDGVIEQFMEGLREPVGSRNRCTLFLGQRGMGKTALLLELSDRAQKEGFVVARCGGTVTTAKLQAKLGKKGPAIQPYRKRLLEAGIIEAPRRGELVFAVPYLAEYLLKEKEQ